LLFDGDLLVNLCYFLYLLVYVLTAPQLINFPIGRRTADMAIG